jgi:hypothetical protein
MTLLRHKDREKAVANTLSLDEWIKLVFDVCDNRCPWCGKEFSRENPQVRDHIIPQVLASA